MVENQYQMRISLGDDRDLIGLLGAQMELDDRIQRRELFPHRPVLLRQQDLLVGIVHGMKAESRQAAFLDPVAHLRGVARVLRVDQAVADQSVGKARRAVGDVTVVPGGPTGLHQHCPVHAVLVHLGQQFVGCAGFVGVGVPGRSGRADRISGRVDLPHMNVGVYKHKLNLLQQCAGS